MIRREVLGFVVMLAVILAISWVGHELGLMRATQGNIARVEHEIEERCH